MLVWRICKAKHATPPLNGEGARLFGGRWNHKGTCLVYTAESQSLATLECLVHLELSDVPKDYQVIGIEIPEEVQTKTLLPANLPMDWQAIPGPESLKRIGSDWIREGKEAVLIVPSAIIANEWNILLNPNHPDAARFRPKPPTPFAFDPRLFS